MDNTNMLVISLDDSSVADAAMPVEGATSLASDVCVADTPKAPRVKRTPKAKVQIRLASGEVVNRGIGRMPIGSVVLNTEGKAITEPVQSTKQLKAPNFRLLKDGVTVVVSSRGRPPAGSRPCDSEGHLL